MKNSITKKMAAFMLLAFASANGFAQQKIGDLGDALETEKTEIFRIVNIIVAVIMFAGTIYIITALIGKRETSKSVIVGWVVALVIWGIANTLFS